MEDSLIADQVVATVPLSMDDIAAPKVKRSIRHDERNSQEGIM
jgi:hypothetical protein